MDFWNKSTEDEKALREDETSVLSKIADFAKDEVIGSASGAVVEYLSGGWLTSDGFEFGNDEDEHRVAQRDNRSFEERLEAELAKLVVQPVEHPPISAMQTDTAPFEVLAQSPVAAPAIAQTERPLSAVRRGFGRKGL